MAGRGCGRGGGSPAPTPFSIQAILNKKDEPGGRRSLPPGRLQPLLSPAEGALPSPDVAPACCWRLFGDEAATLALALQPPPPAAAAAAPAWDSDSALSDEQEAGKEDEDDDEEEAGDEEAGEERRAAARRPRHGPAFPRGSGSPSERPVLQQPPAGLGDRDQLSARLCGKQPGRQPGLGGGVQWAAVERCLPRAFLLGGCS